MNQYLRILTLIGLFVSCGEKAKDDSRSMALPPDLKYTILAEKTNEVLKKDNVDVELNRNVSKEDLMIIANQIRETRKDYDKLWISYFLTGTVNRNTAYAVSNFTPELTISFNGATAQEKDKFASVADSIDGKIIGKWREEPYTASTFVFYEKKGKYFVRQIMKVGPLPDNELMKSKSGKLFKYQEKSDTHGEYYVIDLDGRLLFYNKEGKNFTTGSKM